MAISNKVLVIFGAGASHGVLSRGFEPSSPDWRPPLTNELFTRAVFRERLGVYPGAQNLAPQLSRADDLEKALLRYSKATEHHAGMFHDVPLYLRAIIDSCAGYINTGGNYGELLSILKEQDCQVAVLTLNYDTLFETALQKFYYRHRPGLIRSFDDYQHSAYLLVKAHGSVNWWWKLAQGTRDELHEVWLARDAILRSFSRTDANRLLVVDNLVWLDNYPDSTPYGAVLQRPGQADGDYLLYPCMTLPLAGEGNKEFVCPDAHVQALVSFMVDCTKVLAIGTSAIDEDLLGFLRKNSPAITQLCCVAENAKAAEAAAARLAASMAHKPNPVICGTGFEGFVADEENWEFLAPDYKAPHGQRTAHWKMKRHS